MSRFADFTLLEDLGRNTVARCYRAVSERSDEPVFLQCFDALTPAQLSALGARCDAIGSARADLRQHLLLPVERGQAEGIHYIAWPWIAGYDLTELAASLRERRVVLSLDGILVVLRDILSCLQALHAVPLAHGDVSLRHIRIDSDGKIWLTGTAFARTLPPTPYDIGWDVVGAAAMVYDLLPLTRVGGSASGNAGNGSNERPSLPLPLEKAIRRALGIGVDVRLLRADDFRQKIDEIAQSLHFRSERQPWIDLAGRTFRSIERQRSQKSAAPITPPVAQQPRIAIPTPPAMPSMASLLDLPSPTPHSMAAVAATAAVLGPAFHVPPPADAVSQAVPAAQAMRNIHAAIQSALEIESPPTSVPPPVDLPALHMGNPTIIPAVSLVVPALPAVVYLQEEAESDGHLPVLDPIQIRRPPLLADTALVAVSSQEIPMQERVAVSYILASKVSAPDPVATALLTAEMITTTQLAAVEEEQRIHGGKMIDILVNQQVISEFTLALVLAQSSDTDYWTQAELLQHLPNTTLCQRIPHSFAAARRILPLYIESQTLHIAVVDPFAQDDIEETRSAAQAQRVILHIATKTDLQAAIHTAYNAMQLTSTINANGNPNNGSHIDSSGANLTSPTHTIVVCEADFPLDGLCARLLQEGFALERFASSDEAWAFFQVQHADAILCSHDVKPLQYRDFLLRIRKRAQERDEIIPFFVIGPSTDAALTAQALDWGADDVWTYSVPPDIALAKLRRTLNAVHTLSSSSKRNAPAPIPTSGINPFAGSDDGVVGTLKQMSLPEILQGLEMGRRTALIDVAAIAGERGQLAVIEGQVRHASYRAASLSANASANAAANTSTNTPESWGEDAFYAVLQHTNGFFRIRYGSVGDAGQQGPLIRKPTGFLLLEAMRRLDEQQRGPEEAAEPEF